MNQQKTVLLVHNSILARHIIRKNLAYTEFNIIAESSDEYTAVERFELYDPDIVLLDTMMPEGSGLVALKTIMQINPKTKVIMLLSMGTKETVEHCIEIGASHVESAPYARNLLLNHLRQSTKIMDLKEMIHSN